LVCAFGLGSWKICRVEKILSAFLNVETHSPFLKALKIVSPDNKMHRDGTKKLQQVNHMIRLVFPYLEKLQKQNSTPSKSGETQKLTVVDVGCGNSYLSLALAYVLNQKFPNVFEIIGIDIRNDVIAHSQKIAAEQNLSHCTHFFCGALNDFSKNHMPQKLVGTIALHACDTASDEALAFAILNKCAFVGVAPCCQAQLAQFWKAEKAESELKLKSALRALLCSPNLMRDGAATFTDTLRLSLLRSRGYKAVATEFVESAHTPKNRILLGERCQNWSETDLKEFRDLKESLGSPMLHLEKLLDNQGTEKGTQIHEQ
jgi:SAM-dependent methyltransferase